MLLYEDSTRKIITELNNFKQSISKQLDKSGTDAPDRLQKPVFAVQITN
jgi:hypothetical protein